jgi:hypothetical protein
VLRWRVLLSNGFLQLGRICRVHALPSLINNRIGNAVLNRWCLRRRRFKDGRRRYYLELVAREGLADLAFGSVAGVSASATRRAPAVDYRDLLERRRMLPSNYPTSFRIQQSTLGR